jgi:hypothetical protein
MNAANTMPLTEKDVKGLPDWKRVELIMKDKLDEHGSFTIHPNGDSGLHCFPS